MFMWSLVMLTCLWMTERDTSDGGARGRGGESRIEGWSEREQRRWWWRLVVEEREPGGTMVVGCVRGERTEEREVVAACG
uniref:Secreted protein n=1 Tax=Cannabis sativa TaxID=3483 RepID=A0A803QAF7_CANSA